MFKVILKIAKAELQKMFYSPIAWVLLIVFVVQCGMGLSSNLDRIEQMQRLGRLACFSNFIFTDGSNGILKTLYQYIYLYIPLLTMGLISEELRNKNINLLYAAPLTNTQIILGKYLSVLTYGLFLVGIVLIFIVFGIIAIQDFELGVMLSGLLGLFLMFMVYAAIGLFVSSLTSYPIVAAIGSFMILSVLSNISSFWQEYDFFRDITWWLSINGRAGELIQGLICSEDVLYFLIISVLFILLTIIRLNAVRQKVKFSITFGKNVIVVVVACLLGYISSRPVFMFYCDTSRTKYNTLTPATQKLLAGLKGVTVNNYHNILNMEGWEAALFFINADQERFRPFMRFNPRLEIKNIYYHDTVITPYNKDWTVEEHTNDLEGRKKSLNVKKIFTAEEIKQQVDLSGEGKGFVRQLINEENGRKAWLRVYDNAFKKHPLEAEIAVALRRLIMDPFVVGVVEGFGARSIYDQGTKGYYYRIAHKKTRDALVNQGFDVIAIDLACPIPDSLAVLVISDLQEPLTAEADRHLQEYIDRGGNLYVLGEPSGREVMNPVFEKFGFELFPGTLVKLDSLALADRLFSYVTHEAPAVNYWFMRPGIKVATFGTSALVQKRDLGYTVIPLLRTDTVNVWNELETKYITEEHPVVFNPEAGERMDAWITMVALSRKINEREQRIVLSGDADWMANADFKGDVYNEYACLGPFSWFTHEEAPMDVRRPARTDKVFKMDIKKAKYFGFTMKYVFPGLLFIVFLFLLFRRRGR